MFVSSDNDMKNKQNNVLINSQPSRLLLPSTFCLGHTHLYIRMLVKMVTVTCTLSNSCILRLSYRVKCGITFLPLWIVNRAFIRKRTMLALITYSILLPGTRRSCMWSWSGFIPIVSRRCRSSKMGLVSALLCCVACRYGIAATFNSSSDILWRCSQEGSRTYSRRWSCWSHLWESPSVWQRARWATLDVAQ